MRIDNMTGRIDIDRRTYIGRSLAPWVATKANPSKDGDAKLRGYRTQMRVTPAEPPTDTG